MDKRLKILVGFSAEEYPGVLQLQELGDCEFVRYDEEFLLRNLGFFDILVPHLFLKLDGKILSAARRLRMIATPSTGRDHLDMKFIENNSLDFVSLADDPEFINSISSTAEMAFLLILACARKLPFLQRRVLVEKSWINTDIRGIELSGKTLGIIGYGRLGKMVATYAKAFNMNVIAYDINPLQYDERCEGVSLEHLIRNSDIITLHAKLNNTSRNILDVAAVQSMKDGVMIVNTARGGLIDSDAVLEGLRLNKIAALGIDVCNLEYNCMELPQDPLVIESMSNPRIIVTPHAGGSTHDAHDRIFHCMTKLIKMNLEGFIK